MNQRRRELADHLFFPGVHTRTLYKSGLGLFGTGQHGASVYFAQLPFLFEPIQVPANRLCRYIERHGQRVYLNLSFRAQLGKDRLPAFFMR
ncbi:hypothetical protein D3C73_1334180 [compost metagenome]